MNCQCSTSVQYGIQSHGLKCAQLTVVMASESDKRLMYEGLLELAGGQQPQPVCLLEFIL